MLIELALLGGGVLYWLKNRQNQSRPNQTKTNSVKASNINKFSFMQLIKDIKKAIAADGRRQLHVEIDPKQLESVEKERQKNSQRLKLSGGATVFAILGSIYPVFSVFAVLGVLYLSRRIFVRAWKDIKLKHYLTTNLIALIMTISMIALGQLVLAAFAAVIGSFFAKIVDRVEDRTQQQLINVFAGHPQQVWVLKDGVEIQMDFHAIQANDIVIVNAGEVIPIDGIIKSGAASIDQHILTGENQPIEKFVGDSVFASTLLLSGRVSILVETAGEATVAAKIGQVLNQTQSYKDTLITRGRQVSDRFLPVTMGISAVTLPVLGLHSATAVLWSGIGATMGALGPLTVLIYQQILSRQSILVKDGRAFESLRQVNTIIFDKTGTLTLEQPTVTQIHSFGEYTSNTILKYAAAAEYRQPHPVAKAVLAKAEELQLQLPEFDEANYEVGYGIKVIIDKQIIRVGSARFLQREGIKCPETIQSIQQQPESKSHSLIYVSIDQQLAGILEMQPTIRPEAKEMIQYLKQRGLKLVIISGDHEQPTRKMAETLGIERYFAEIMPENKAKLVKQLRNEGGFVCFIGDGINDAIALKSAQLSISLKGASTAATDTAQIIFMDGTLKHLKQLFQFMDEFEDTMKTNMTTSIMPGAISIGGIYLLHFGSAAAMGIFYLGCFAGLGNSLWPLVKYQKDKE